MERKQCTFYKSFWDAIQGLPAKKRGDAALMLIEYGLFAKEPELPENSPFQMLFTMAKPVLDKQIKLARNGAIGGQAGSKQAESKSEANNKQSESKSQANRKQIASEGEAPLERDTPSPSIGARDRERDRDRERKLAARAREALESAQIRFDEQVVAEAVKQHGEAKVCEAIRKARERGGRTWLYVSRILEDKTQNDQFQAHGQALSPMMAAAARKLMEQEDELMAESEGGAE